MCSVRRGGKDLYTWFSDLDNTLIYSHRTTFSTEKVVVELLNDRVQSYMTKATYVFLKNMSLDFVPVTTRSIEQYKRIFIFEKDIKVKHALVCNGAVLLNNGVIDVDWLNETKNLAKNEINTLNIIRKSLKGYDIKDVEGVMIYFASEQPEKIANELRRKYEYTNIYVGFDKRKVYLVPRSINKGNAIVRYCNRFFVEKTISSGDSDFDVPMANLTDYTFVSNLIINKVNRDKNVFSLGEDTIISDKICELIEILIKEKKI